MSLRPEKFAQLLQCADALGLSPTALLETQIGALGWELGIDQMPREEAIATIPRIVRRARAGGVWSF